MDDFTQMHIFFAVTTGAVILITALVCAVLFMLARFLRTLDRIAEEVEEEAAEIRADLSELRSGLKKGFRFVPWFGFFGKTAKRLSTKKRARKDSRS
jgi:hypothetical protein